MDIQKLVNYDDWANQRIFSAMKKVGKSSKKDKCKKLFAHLLTAQKVWVHRIKKLPLPEKIWPDLSISEMKTLLIENPAKLHDLIAAKEEIIDYKNSKGEVFTNTVEEILLHIIIHGQHHRAQIAKLIREAGVDPPATDFIFFLRSLDN
ncbi:MAG: DinB family protein [Gracilimonas sp.]|nr:DinB family protein [Gracilimonas sp.]